MITGINKLKILAKHIYYEKMNIHFIVRNINRIKIGIMIIKVPGSSTIQKNIMHVKKIILEILMHAVMKMFNI